MCLSIVVDDPTRVLAMGVEIGYQWVVTHNGMGYRCGYVRIPPGHPWHGKDYDDVEPYPAVHGGLTFAEPDVACDKEGDDNAWWLGFDCAHAGDAPDPTLPTHVDRIPWDDFQRGGVMCHQAYVETDCKRLCYQAEAARHR